MADSSMRLWSNSSFRISAHRMGLYLRAGASGPLSYPPALSEKSLRFPGCLFLALRPFHGLGHAAQLALKMRYRQIIAGQPSIQADIEHVLFERSGVSADSDQHAPLGRLADDGVKRTASAQVAMKKCR